MNPPATPILNILIVDDEAPARMRLRDLLGDIAGELPHRIVGEAADGLEALARLAEAQPPVDVLLVDIRMPKLDGMGLALRLSGRDDAPAVIFVTAFDQYAVQAFELNAIDYLLKPVRASRLRDALQKLTSRMATQSSVASSSSMILHGGREARSHLNSSERGRILRVPVAEILYLRAEQKYVTARTSAQEYLLEESLTHLEEEFGERFVRIHRNCLVARQAIRGVEREADAEGQPSWVVLLHGSPERLPISRRQWSQLKTIFKEEA